MKNALQLLTLSLLMITSPASAERPLGPVEMTSVDELAYAIAAYFPKVHGEVTAVQGDKLTLSLGEKNGVLPGMVLTVWRDGSNILHPLTGAVIGRVEDEVGTVEVVSVKEATSVAVMKKQAREPKAGDRARITPKKINIGILPFQGDKPEITNGLAEKLGELGRFTVLGNDKVNAFLRDRKQRDAALVKEMGSAFALDVVVALGTFPSEGKFLVTARIFTVDDAKPIDTIVALLSLTSKREALGDVRPFFAPVKDVSGKMPDLPVAARFFAIADLDGDGAVEYVFSDEKKLSIYRPEKAEWKMVWTEPVDKKEREMQQVRVEVADINGNGRPEIFVTRMLNDSVSSYVVEFQDGAFRRTADVPGFLRVVRYPGRGPVLIGQEYSPETFFAGQPREYSGSGSTYTAGAEVPLPKGTDLYSFVVADLGEKRPFVVALDKDNRLVVYSGDTRLWRSEEQYLTVETVLTKPLTGVEAAVASDSGGFNKANIMPPPLMDKSRIVRIDGRFLAADLQGSGSDVLVVAKNTSSGLSGEYKGGELEVLAWNGARLDPRWTSKDLPGPVMDIQTVGSEKGGSQIKALIKVPGGVFGKDKYRVETYDGK